MTPVGWLITLVVLRLAMPITAAGEETGCVSTTWWL